VIRSLARAFATLVLVACHEAGDDPTGSGSVCDELVRWTLPRTGADDVYYRSGVRFELRDPDPTALVSVHASNGEAVRGETTSVGTTVRWTPAPGVTFDPARDYVASLAAACGGARVEFTTSDTGLPLRVDVVGRTYVLDAIDLGTGPRLLFVSPTRIGGGLVEMTAAFGTGTEQDICRASVDLPPADYRDPFFAIASSDLEIPMEGGAGQVNALSLSGAFSPDGRRIQSLSVSGTVDARDFDPTGEGLNELCSTILECRPCDSDAEPLCLSAALTADLYWLEDATLTPRTLDEVIADDRCEEPAR